MRKRAWFIALLLAACGGVEDAEVGQEIEVAACKDTWSNYAGKFFHARCATCHAHQFDTAAEVKRSGARSAIASGAMPRDKALTAAQKKRILAWFQCGAH